MSLHVFIIIVILTLLCIWKDIEILEQPCYFDWPFQRRKINSDIINRCRRKIKYYVSEEYIKSEPIYIG